MGIFRVAEQDLSWDLGIGLALSSGAPEGKRGGAVAEGCVQGWRALGHVDSLIENYSLFLVRNA